MIRQVSPPVTPDGNVAAGAMAINAARVGVSGCSRSETANHAGVPKPLAACRAVARVSPLATTPQTSAWCST